MISIELTAEQAETVTHAEISKFLDMIEENMVLAETDEEVKELQDALITLLKWYEVPDENDTH